MSTGSLTGSHVSIWATWSSSRSNFERYQNVYVIFLPQRHTITECFQISGLSVRPVTKSAGFPPHGVSDLFVSAMRSHNLPESVSMCSCVRSLEEDYTQSSKCRQLSGNWNSQMNKSQNSHNTILQEPISDRPLPGEL